MGGSFTGHAAAQEGQPRTARLGLRGRHAGLHAIELRRFIGVQHAALVLAFACLFIEHGQPVAGHPWQVAQSRLKLKTGKPESREHEKPPQAMAVKMCACRSWRRCSRAARALWSACWSANVKRGSSTTRE